MSFPIHLMITFQPLEPNLPMKYPGLVTDGSSYADYIVRSNNKFFFIPISSNVFSPLNKLSKSKATGLDNISAKLLNSGICGSYLDPFM